jgi:ribulose-bisphosphate carboxylase large chain
MDPNIYARYWIETAYPLEQAAATMAGEQSTGTFTRVPGETDELRELHAARVCNIVELEPVSAPSLPGAGVPKGLTGPPIYRRAEVELSWPLTNMGPSLPNLLATVAGNLSELKPFSGLKLLDIRLPRAFLDRYCGPQFGVAGTSSSPAWAFRPEPPRRWCELSPKAASISSRTMSCRPMARTAPSRIALRP